jgi:hypothetical protein
LPEAFIELGSQWLQARAVHRASPMGRIRPPRRVMTARLPEGGELADPAGKALEKIRPIRAEIRDRVINLIEKLAAT